MLTWCAYCQHFQGEMPPFDDYSITHVICPECESTGLEITDAELARLRALQQFYAGLFEAGRRGDLAEAERIVQRAGEQDIRYIDLLFGIVAPALHQIGDDWRANRVTVADGHRFHGGRSRGAPRGERNGNWRSGFYSQDAVADRRRVRALIREMKRTLKEDLS